MKKIMPILIITLPIASVLACIVMFVLATSGNNDFLPAPKQALSKTSWQQP